MNFTNKLSTKNRVGISNIEYSTLNFEVIWNDELEILNLPATSNQQPATSNQQPATSNQQPAVRLRNLQFLILNPKKAVTIS
nr:hypothetical protein [Gracilimonas mengyeensis]